MNLRSSLINLTVLAASLLFSVGLTESVGRYLRSSYEQSQDIRKEFFKKRKELLLQKKAGSAKWVSHDEFDNLVELNSQGYHDYERQFEKQTKSRILFLGDSFVEARQVRRSEIFYNLLNTEFEQGQVSIEALGLGTSGTGPLSYYKTYRDKGLKYSPDLVVSLVLLENDIENDYFPFSIKRGYLPKLVLNENGEIRKFREIFPEINKPPKQNKPAPQAPFSASLKGIGHLSSQAARNNFLFYQTAAALGIISESANREHVASSFQLMLKSPPAYVKQGIKNTLRILKSFEREVRSNGQEFLVVLLPGTYQADIKLFHKKLANFPASKDLEYDIDYPFKLLEQGLQKRKVSTLNLLPEFRKLTQSGAKLYWPTDGHLNQRGHQALSEILLKHLKENFETLEL